MMPLSVLPFGRAVLSTLGTFWAAWFGEKRVTEQLLAAQAELLQQHADTLHELRSSLSVHTAQPLSSRPWGYIDLLESECLARLPKYGEGYKYDGAIQYDTPVDSIDFRVPLPAGYENVRSFTCIVDAHTDPSVLFTYGIDVEIENGELRFSMNPFRFDKHAVPVFEAGRLVDRRLRLWLYNIKHDAHTLWSAFGRTSGPIQDSSDSYARFLRAAASAKTKVATVSQVNAAFAALFCLPFAETAGTVEDVFTHESTTYVVLPDKVYRIPAGFSALVSKGQQVKAGMSLSSALATIEIRLPLPETLEVPGLVIPPAMLRGEYKHGLTFANRTVPVSRDQAGNAGFEIGGTASDIALFWDTVHASDSLAGALADTVNPLRFVLEHLFAGAAVIVLLRPGVTITAEQAATTPSITELFSPGVWPILFVEFSAQTDYTRLDATETAVELQMYPRSDTLSLESDADTIVMSSRAACQ